MKKKGLLSGVVVGFLNGFFASGGGIAAVMVLKNIFRLDEKKAHATSIFIILPLTVAGIIVYTMGGYSDFSVVIRTAIGSSLGSFFGATLLSKLPPNYIRMGFGAMMVISAVRMIMG